MESEVYFAANEDGGSLFTKIWITPGDEHNYGLLNMGYADMFPQTIINDQGLVMDGFGSDELEVKETNGKTTFKGVLFLEVLKKCATVEEALEMISEYNLEFLSHAQILIGDKTGDSALIEGDVIHRKEGSYQVATNFNLSKTESITCYRYNLACKFLEKEHFSNEDLRSILQETKQYSTRYSYIINLTKGTMELYFFGDFETSETFNISQEINQGPYIINMAELFENNAYNLSLVAYQQKKLKKLDIPIDGISNYTGYYHFSNMDFGIDIVESDGSLKCILDGFEFEMIPAKDDFFFFEELDHTLYFQKKSSTKIYGVDLKNPDIGMNEFAKKIHPFWVWFYRL